VLDRTALIFNVSTFKNNKNTTPRCCTCSNT